MSRVAVLARMMKELEDQFVTCMRCGLCQSVCPLYAETGREADVARGKLALLDGLAGSLLENPAEARERLERCLLCGSCQANCPSGVPVLDIFLKARAILAGYLGLSPAKRLVFRRLLAHPGLFDQVLAWGSKLQGALAKPVSETLGTSCARVAGPLGERHFRRLAPLPLHTLVPSRHTTPGPDRPRVAFFVGCLVDKIFPAVGQAALKVLAHHGVGVSLPAGQACCGIPALASGDRPAFTSLLAHNLARFDPAGFDYLVTACATCTSTIKKVWPLLTQDLSPAERTRVAEISRKTLDIGQFLGDMQLVRALAPQPGQSSREVTYHDPCHLKKALGVFREPRELIRANPAYNLREMAEADWCCGMGGSFNLAHYELSRSIGRRKSAQILATGCSTVATGCPACMLQISDVLSQEGQALRVRHYLELYAEGLPD
ncbi:MAG: (Fe-S)-binding protein [Deltaproteobacteria bacterium]|nr:(Fe-S)-binding protein [Deltaproteobacteria bacterium]